MHSVSVAVVVAASVLLMLTRPRGIAEVWWIAGGAAVLVLARLVGVGAAARAVGKGADVYAFLAGMMLLSELARAHGVFDWLASLAMRSARGSSMRLFGLVYAIGVVVTTFLSNDATAVVLTPAILVVVAKAKVDARPHLFACALVANAASFVLPISNPANLVLFDGAMPSLGRWLASFLVASVASILATYGVLRLFFRPALAKAFRADAVPSPLARSGRCVLAALVGVAVVLLVASSLHVDLGLPTLGAALVVVLGTSLATRRNPAGLVRSVSWSTLVLVAGLFVMVEAMDGIGAARTAGQGLGWAARHGAMGSIVAAVVVGVLDNVVNNLPLGLLAGATVAQAHPPDILARAILVGVDLGPNLAITGSLATLLWLVALRKARVEVSFFQFLRVGALVMPPALLAALAGLLATNHVLR